MATQQSIDQRLDAVDRALLGLLPRSERLAVVADVESRLSASGTAPATENTTPRTIGDIVASGRSRVARRRSGLALTAGIVGLVALGLFLFLPLTYLLVAVLGEALGEEIAYGLLCLNIVIVAFCGAAAVVMGITALVRLSRRRGWLGHGWAITGLCTGPVPALAGGLLMLVFVLPITMQLASSVSDRASPAGYVTAPASFVVPNALPPTACESGTCTSAPVQWVAAPACGPSVSVPPPNVAPAAVARHPSPPASAYAPSPVSLPDVYPATAPAKELPAAPDKPEAAEASPALEEPKAPPAEAPSADLLESTSR